jgi:hypothetical protein
VGAIKNAIIAEHLFPDFETRFYIGKSVPTWVVQTLSLMPKVQILMVEGPENHTSMYWRFLAFTEKNYDRIVIKDADARLTYRDALAHDEWVKSGLDFHIVKDHPTGHSEPIIGCHFGAKVGVLEDIVELMESYNVTNQYGSDQWFLRDKVYDRAIKSALVHDGYYNTQVQDPSLVFYPPPRKWILDHIGAALTENDEFSYEIDRQTAISHHGSPDFIYNLGR